MKNSVNPDTIDHIGTVQKADNNSVIVCISAASACSACHAKGACILSDKKEKIIEVMGKYDVKPGDTVTILMKRSMGYAALFLAYLLPLITVIIVLSVLISINTPELLAGLTSLAILIPYYLVLLVFKNRINENFTFTLKV